MNHIRSVDVSASQIIMDSYRRHGLTQIFQVTRREPCPKTRRSTSTREFLTAVIESSQIFTSFKMSSCVAANFFYQRKECSIHFYVEDHMLKFTVRSRSVVNNNCEKGRPMIFHRTSMVYLFLTCKISTVSILGINTVLVVTGKNQDYIVRMLLAAYCSPVRMFCNTLHSYSQK